MSDGADSGAPSDPAVVGRALRPHGLAGDIVVEPQDPSSVACDLGDAVWLAGRWRRVVALRVDSHGRWVVRFEDVNDREQAEALRGAELVIEAAELPDLDDGRYYIHDLVGCRVRDTRGADLGEVVGVFPGPQDWLEIEHEGGRSLVPMVWPMMKQVDVGGRCIVIDPPPGLVEVTRI